MRSYRKARNADDLGRLGLDPATSHDYYEVAELFIPQKETRCEFVSDTLEEKVDQFAARISQIMRSL